MFGMKKPKGILAGQPTGYSPFENVDGIDVRNADAVYENMGRKGLLDSTVASPSMPQAPVMVAQDQPMGMRGPDANQPVQMPKMPPSARSTDPFAKANVRRTLLDISAAFGGADDFGSGLGRAAGAIGSRMDQLQAEATPQRKQGVGPDGSFEAITDPMTGETTYQRIPEFQQVLDQKRQEDRADKYALSPEEIIDQRSRVMTSILKLPPDQQEAAYMRIKTSPEAYGVDVTGLPERWDPMMAGVAANMGLSAHQAGLLDDRDAELARKREADALRAQQSQARISQGERRLRQSPANRPKSSPKPPSGFILD